VILFAEHLFDLSRVRLHSFVQKGERVISTQF